MRHQAMENIIAGLATSTIPVALQALVKQAAQLAEHSNRRPLFDAGAMLRTPAAMLALIQAATTESELIERHQCGDWGDITDADRRVNDLALQQGGQLVSLYRLRTNRFVLVVTAGDRRSTRVVLPEAPRVQASNMGL